MMHVSTFAVWLLLTAPVLGVADQPGIGTAAAASTLAVDTPAVVGAAAGSAAPPAAGSGEALRVFLITMGPGDHVWEHFGHNALWIHDPVNGSDQAYNYGIFDFEQPGFIRNFIQGRMLYSMAGFDAYQTIAHYRAINRSVWVQELNLTPAQKSSLQEFLEWNELPENSFYQYDYYRDNCSTRIRDALDLVLDGRIRAQTTGVLTGSSYRSHTRRLTSHDPPIYLGIKLATGQPVDQSLSVWDEMFLPMSMQQHLRTLTVRDGAGREVPLVLDEATWFVADREPTPASPPRTWPWFLVSGLVLGGLMAGMGAGAPRHRAAAIGFGVLAAAWLVFNGVLGTIIGGLWAFTDHAVTYGNENLLQFHPLSLALLVLLVVGRWRPPAADAARWLAIGIAALAVLGLLLKLLPAFHQTNADILALAVPAHIGLALGARMLGAAWSPAKTTDHAHVQRRAVARPARA